MQNGTIVWKLKGHELPSDFVEKALKNQTSFGVAQQDGGIIQMSRVKITYTPEMFKTINTGLKDRECVLYFQHGPNPTHIDDVNPFIILENERKEPILVAFLDGDFSSHEKADSSHSSQFFVATELQERIKTIHNRLGSKISETMKTIEGDGELSQELFNTMIGNRGSIMLLSSEVIRSPTA